MGSKDAAKAGQKDSSKRSFQGQQKGNNKRFKKQKGNESARTLGSHEEVLEADIRSLLREQDKKSSPHESHGAVTDAEQQPEQPPERFSEVEVDIKKLSSTGDGLGFLHRKDDAASTSDVTPNSRVYVVPFTLPGDVALARVVHNNNANTSRAVSHTLCDYLRILSTSPQRDDSLVRCRYFTACSGCQFQHLPYAQQLAHKQEIYTRAFTNFSNLQYDLIPAVKPTIGSPLQYGYRTKLTPHFDGPPGSMSRGARRRGEVKGFERTPEIGFMRKGGKRGVTVDIEECVIGTEAVGKGLTKERERVGRELGRYKKGATLLLRESSVKVPKKDQGSGTEDEPRPENGVNSEESTTTTNDPTTTYEDRGHDLPYLLRKTCITDPKGTSTEYVDDFIFENPANSFFQNNNSILPRFTQYIRDHVLGPHNESPNSDDATLPVGSPPDPKDDGYTPRQAAEDSNIKNLIDAYSGSGLFSLTLSRLFTRTLGIDISADSITSAKHNLTLNNLSETNDSSNHENTPDFTPQKQLGAAKSESIDFLSADASALFSHPAIIGTPTSEMHSSGSTNDRSDGFDPSNTAVILDPPRKGCDLAFLRQLRDFGPKRVVYVSCNVHTQARDVGWLVGGDGDLRHDGQEHGHEAGEESTSNRTEHGAEMTPEERRTTEICEVEGLVLKKGKEKAARYEIESLQPFDFFPQTAHVEGVAVLRRVE